MFRLVVVSCLALGAALAKPASLSDGESVVPVPFEDLDPVPFREGLIPLDVDSGRAVNVLPQGRYVLKSPRYPFPYPNGISFSLTVQGMEGQTVSISCNPFSLQADSSCRFDYLSINGVKYCGTRVISTISASTLSLAFKSDYWIALTGFKCVITVPEATGTTSTTTGTTGTTATTTTTTTTTAAPPTGGCRCGQRQNSRVVGGTEAAIGAFPWQAGLVQPRGTRTFCGGSVINNRYVLTAAHCTAGNTASGIQVLLGDHRIGTADAGETRYSVVQIIDHPSYTSASGSGMDFSLLKLDREITFTNTISPVCLAEAGQTYAGATAIASGFGRLGANEPQATTLQEVQLPVWEQSACARRWGSTLKDNMICAGGLPEGGKSVCMGDSGGPLVTEVSGAFRLIGVVSFGQPCAIANSPDVFARVTSALTWIASNTADAETCSP